MAEPRPSAAGVRVFAPAKINLSLHVGPPRADGRHPLQSLVVFADVGDWVSAAPARDAGGAGTFTVTGPFAAGLAGGGGNLVLSAWAGVRGALTGVDVTLEKHLPVASGIGGGSADAAAALRAANAFPEPLGLTLEALEAIAAPLGADVPVCVRCRPARMGGTGERLAPFAPPPLHGVLANPGVSTPTGPVYRQFDAMGLGAGFVEEAAPLWRDAGEAIAGLRALRNDLEAPACALEPAIGEVLERLRGAPETLMARMSGSGATCFALVEGPAQAKALALSLAQDRPGWWTAPVRLGAVDGRPVRA